jgi:hypothetical protein
MNDSEININDERLFNDFKNETFSKFQKSQVKNELINCLIASKIESACYWSIELICAGHYIELWESILLFIGKYIHLGNPKLPIYVALRFNNFKDILTNGYLDDELQLRNNIKIRQLFAEIICVLCLSRKKHSLEMIKIKKDDEFNITSMSSKLNAPSIKYANGVFKSDDPKELFIAINEFAYHVSSESKNVISACYWLEWILEYEVICKLKKEKCVGENRGEIAPTIPDKFKNDIIWIVWDVLLHECNNINQNQNKNKTIITKIITSLIELFSIKYTAGAKRKRKYIIYFAISLLTDPIDFTIDIMNNKPKIEGIIKKINVIYKEIKKNEIVPQDDDSYLFDGLNPPPPPKTSLDKTIKQLDKMNEILNQTCIT